MIDRRYLNWKNKLGYGAGDVAGNVVYAFLSTFLMFYLTDTVGMNVGVVGILIAVSRILDAATDLIFGNLLDRTDTKLGKARPWMLYGYIGCAVMLGAVFMIPTGWGDAAKYAYFFITYTLLNAGFYTVNNIAYAALNALITKNTSERVQLGTIPRRRSSPTRSLPPAVSTAKVTFLTGNILFSRSTSAMSGLRTNAGFCAPTHLELMNGPSRCTPGMRQPPLPS